MNIIEQLDREQIARLGKDIPEFSPGDTVVVNVKVKEGERTACRPMRASASPVPEAA